MSDDLSRLLVSDGTDPASRFRIPYSLIDSIIEIASNHDFEGGPNWGRLAGRLPHCSREHLRAILSLLRANAESELPHFIEAERQGIDIVIEPPGIPWAEYPDGSGHIVEFRFDPEARSWTAPMLTPWIDHLVCSSADADPAFSSLQEIISYANSKPHRLP